MNLHVPFPSTYHHDLHPDPSLQPQISMTLSHYFYSYLSQQLKPINKLPSYLSSSKKQLREERFINPERTIEEDFDKYLEDGKLIDEKQFSEIIKGCEDMGQLSPEARYDVTK